MCAFHGNEKCAAITQYIREHISEELTISALAQAFNISESTLRRNVEDCFGQTVYEYVRQLRMEQAVFLLNDLNIPIKAISKMVGFVSHGAFTHSYKQYFGKSPNDTRNYLRKRRKWRK